MRRRERTSRGKSPRSGPSSIPPAEALREGGGEKRNEDLVVPGQPVAAADTARRPLHDVRARPVGLDEVEVRGREVAERVPEVPDERDRLQEDLGKERSEERR